MDKSETFRWLKNCHLKSNNEKNYQGYSSFFNLHFHVKKLNEFDFELLPGLYAGYVPSTMGTEGLKKDPCFPEDIFSLEINTPVVCIINMPWVARSTIRASLLHEIGHHVLYQAGNREDLDLIDEEVMAWEFAVRNWSHISNRSFPIQQIEKCLERYVRAYRCREENKLALDNGGAKTGSFYNPHDIQLKKWNVTESKFVLTSNCIEKDLVFS